MSWITKKRNVDQWINEKNNEYQVLKNNQNESNVIITNIRNAEKNIQQSNKTMAEAKNVVDNTVKEFFANQKIISNQIEESKKLMDKANHELEDITKISKDCLKGVEDNLESTNKSVENIKRMMGYIADGTLNHSFNKRKQGINKNAVKWFWISVISFVLAIAWIVIVFTFLRTNTGCIWADILIGAIKSSIAVFAFGFALNEYGKERNLQEEYAFREAVAGTLTAYLEQLETCEKEEMKNLLIETVEKLYTKPVISAKEYKMMKIDTKDIADSIKPIVDVVKPVAEMEKK